ncbi:MAG: DoxX family protein [Cyclobacteriaceae bacterium]|nr:DoxX family protein [Cyclobacteriaceae bacterium SS2]
MKNKIIYWTATGLIAAMMLMSGFAYFTDPQVAEGFSTMGFRDFFRVELGAAKLLGALVLLLPMIQGRIREWTFAGFAITFISAFIAHLSIGDSLSTALVPLIALVLLSISHFYFYKTYGAA